MTDARELLQFCPRCGAPAFSSENGHRFACGRCDFVLFFNIATGSGCLIQDDTGHLLVCVRARDPGQGMLDLPGGFVDHGEGAEHAAIRECEEELNLQIHSLRYLTSQPNIYEYREVTYRVCDVFYRARVHDFSPIEARDDVAGFAFVDPLTVDLGRFAFTSARSAVALLREELV
jgi:ADP-ribose pyrophosphatase YjhB (NUDIX family)